MKFLLIKGFSGFGDRIEHLLWSLLYLKKSGRTLVVDWTDHVWCGKEFNNDFYYYFNLKDINVITLKDFKSLFLEHKKNNKRFTFLPEFFKDIVFRRSDENDVKYKFGDIQVFFNKVCNGEMNDLPYDVIVTTDLDNRNWGGIIRIPSLVYKEFIMDYIKKDENYNFLMNNKFISVHLRGTDRSSFTEDYRPDLTNFSHHTDTYVDNIIKKIPEGTKNILLLSDSTILVSNFLKKIKNDYNIIQTYNEKSSKNIGLHIEPCESKVKKNLEMLKDFYFMTNSYMVICDEISRFSLVCKRICDLKNNRSLE